MGKGIISHPHGHYKKHRLGLFVFVVVVVCCLQRPLPLLQSSSSISNLFQSKPRHKSYPLPWNVNGYTDTQTQGCVSRRRAIYAWRLQIYFPRGLRAKFTSWEFLVRTWQGFDLRTHVIYAPRAYSLLHVICA